MRAIPYVLFAIGLFGGLIFFSFAPLPSAWLNGLAGGACLAAAIASVTYMIAANSGPGERGPDF